MVFDPEQPMPKLRILTQAEIRRMSVMLVDAAIEDIRNASIQTIIDLVVQLEELHRESAKIDSKRKRRGIRRRK